jgi:hypothetical protein
VASIASPALRHGLFRAVPKKPPAIAELPNVAGVTLAPGTMIVRAAGRSAGWLALTVAGWCASLQLVDAPPRVAYQHLHVVPTNPAHWIALAIGVVQLMLLLTVGRTHVAAVVHWIRTNFRLPLAIVVAGLLIVPAAVPSRDPAAYLIELAASSSLQLLALGSLVAAIRSAPDSFRALVTGLADRLLGPAGVTGPHRIDAWVIRLALGAVGVAAILAWFVYEAHPHVPDEVAYLLHARYLAEGMLTMPIPPVPASFNIDLMYYESSRWFSPVPPGWPMMLAVGVWLGAPWLVNPMLGGVAIILCYLLLGQLTEARETRLTTLLLASSPWFLFMSMNFMTHTLSLVCALAAAVGVATSRRNGSWIPSLLAGVAVGATSLVRPLEGLTTAVLLGFWSLSARGRLFRLAPSVALVVGTIATGLLVRPYNAMLTGSSREFPLMAYIDKYYGPGSNDLGFGPNRGLGWSGLDPFPGHGPLDVVVNGLLNIAQLNVELTGWPIGAVVLLTLVLTLRGTALRRADWWLVAVIAAVVGAHTLYWFSGGPDFGARYWYLIIVPCCALMARSISRLDERVGGAAHSSPGLRSVALMLMALTLVVYVPWRATGKYRHYRGMRADIRHLARQHRFGRSLVLVRGARHPDYASAAAYNPIDLKADAPIYAWDATRELRAALLKAYPDRPVWIVDGPSVTGGAYRVSAGPLTPEQMRTITIPSLSSGDEVFDPVNPPRGAAR